MAEEKTTKIEREYTIPLREKCRVVPRYKKTNKAIRTIREFLVKHMTIRDRDLNKIKIDYNVNEAIWARGIRYPPHKIKIKATKEGDIVKVEMAQLSPKAIAKKARLEKRETMAAKQPEAHEHEEHKATEKVDDGVDNKKEIKETKEAAKDLKQKEAKAEHKAAEKTTKENKKKATDVEKGNKRAM